MDMSLSKKWVVCAIAIAMSMVVAGNALAPVAQPQPQQDQRPNNSWVIPVAIVVGGIVIAVIWGAFEAGGI
jgi:hypothetical protein